MTGRWAGGPLWSAYDRRTGQRATVVAWNSPEAVEREIEEWRERDRKGKRQDVHDLLPHLEARQIDHSSTGLNGENEMSAPLPGPIDSPPWPDDAREMLDAALAGVELGAYDRRIVDWVKGWDPPTIATIASLIDRAAQARSARL